MLCRGIFLLEKMYLGRVKVAMLLCRCCFINRKVKRTKIVASVFTVLYIKALCRSTVCPLLIMLFNFQLECSTFRGAFLERKLTKMLMRCEFQQPLANKLLFSNEQSRITSLRKWTWPLHKYVWLKKKQHAKESSF